MPEPHFRDDTDRLTWADTQAGYHRPPAWLRPKTILDLGCNAGFTLLDFRELYPDAEIWAAEMDLDNFLIANGNVGDDPLIHIFNVAIASENGIAKYDGEWANNAFRIGTGTKSVCCVTLDRFCEHLPPIDFAKIDIEGTERLVFSAGGEIWPEKILALKAEIHPPYGVEEAITDLMALGYAAIPGEGHELSVFAWR